MYYKSQKRCFLFYKAKEIPPIYKISFEVEFPYSPHEFETIAEYKNTDWEYVWWLELYNWIRNLTPSAVHAESSANSTYMRDELVASFIDNRMIISKTEPLQWWISVNAKPNLNGIDSCWFVLKVTIFMRETLYKAMKESLDANGIKL